MILYIHIPFCQSKCGYCAFNSYTNREHQEAYIQSLLLDISHTLACWQAGKLERIIKPDSSGILDSASFVSVSRDKVLESIYIGGGTPSILGADAHERIFATIARYTDIAPKSAKNTAQIAPEITIEANPNSLEKSWCDALVRFGANRISMGAQSFFSQKLAFLEREHSERDICRALELARDFPRKSIDMMYGTPLDTPRALEADIAQACALPIGHISAYSLMIEEGSRFWQKERKTSRLKMQDTALEKQALLVREMLENAGFAQYEVSNYAKSHQSLHNKRYWQGVEYLACGAGAVGRIGDARYMGALAVDAYIKNPLGKSVEHLSDNDLAFEALFMGLRSSVGAEVAKVAKIIDNDRLALAVDEGKCAVKGGRIYASDYFLADEIALWLWKGGK